MLAQTTGARSEPMNRPPPDPVGTMSLDRRLVIGIDARAASHPQPGGFKTYVKNLIGALGASDDGHSYCLFTDREPDDRDSDSWPRFRRRALQSRIPVVGPVLREQLMLPIAVRHGGIDVLHCPCGTTPYVRPTPTVVTIHDALEVLPRALTGSPPERRVRRQLMHLYNHWCQVLAARKAELILTVSEFSRREIAAHLGIPTERIRVVPEAPGPDFSPRPAERSEVPEAGAFLLAIGSADSRKNLTCLVRAYATLPADLIEQYGLVLVWSHDEIKGDLLRLAEGLGIGPRIHSVTAPTDAQLGSLYRAASVFVFPSLYEGFGLPPLEAMACGTPVVSSNAASLPEVLGDGGILVDCRSWIDLARVLDRVLSDDDLRQKLSARGLARAKQFSWTRTASQTVAAYEEVAAASIGRRRPSLVAS